MDKWQIMGYLFAFINPILPGILLGLALYRDNDKDYKETGKNVIILSILMTVVWALFLAKRGIIA